MHPTINTLRLRQNGCHFADNIFNCILSKENIWIPIKISLKFVPTGSINNITVLVHIMAWCQPGDKPLSEPMMIIVLTDLCITRPQWVKIHRLHYVHCTLRFIEVERGYTGFTLSVCLSVRLWTKSCPLCIFYNMYNIIQIHFIFAHLIKQLQKVCHV